MAASIVICRTFPSDNYKMPEPTMVLQTKVLSGGHCEEFENIVAIFETGTYTFYYE